MYEEPEEPTPEEEIAEEPPRIEEVEEVVPPEGTAASMGWTMRRQHVPNLSRDLSLPTTHHSTFLISMTNST